MPGKAKPLFVVSDSSAIDSDRYDDSPEHMLCFKVVQRRKDKSGALTSLKIAEMVPDGRGSVKPHGEGTYAGCDFGDLNIRKQVLDGKRWDPVDFWIVTVRPAKDSEIARQE
jgi:hypothetical protein